MTVRWIPPRLHLHLRVGLRIPLMAGPLSIIVPCKYCAWKDPAQWSVRSLQTHLIKLTPACFCIPHCRLCNIKSAIYQVVHFSQPAGQDLRLMKHTTEGSCYEQNLSLIFFFISFHFIFIFHLISTISRLIPISYLLFPHCLHLVSLSHYFISICLSISISSSSRVISIALVLLSLISIHCLGSHSFHTIYTSLLSFES